MFKNTKTFQIPIVIFLISFSRLVLRRPETITNVLSWAEDGNIYTI